MNVVGYALFVTVLPVLIGRLFCVSEEQDPYALIVRWCSGFTAMLASIYFPALIGIFAKWSLDQLTVVWIVILALLALLAVVAGHPKGTANRPVREFGRQFLDMMKGLTFYEVLAFLAAAAHAALTFFMMHVDDDDSAYVGAVTTSVDTNTLMMFDAVNGNLITDYSVNEMNRLVTSPQFAYYAILSKISGMRPAVVCHTMIPPVLTLLFFGILALIGYQLFDGDRRKAGLFTVLTFLVSSFSYFSVCTSGTFILIRSWQGKAQIVGLIIPLTLYLFLRIIGRGRASWDDALFHAALMGAACLLSSIGGAFAMGESLLLSVLAVFLTRDRRIPFLMFPSYLFQAVMLVLYFRLGG